MNVLEAWSDGSRNFGKLRRTKMPSEHFGRGHIEEGAPNILAAGLRKNSV